MTDSSADDSEEMRVVGWFGPVMWVFIMALVVYLNLGEGWLAARRYNGEALIGRLIILLGTSLAFWWLFVLSRRPRIGLLWTTGVASFVVVHLGVLAVVGVWGISDSEVVLGALGTAVAFTALHGWFVYRSTRAAVRDEPLFIRPSRKAYGLAVMVGAIASLIGGYLGIGEKVWRVIEIRDRRERDTAALHTARQIIGEQRDEAVRLVQGVDASLLEPDGFLALVPLAGEGTDGDRARTLILRACGYNCTSELSEHLIASRRKYRSWPLSKSRKRSAVLYGGLPPETERLCTLYDEVAALEQSPELSKAWIDARAGVAGRLRRVHAQTRAESIQQAEQWLAQRPDARARWLAALQGEDCLEALGRMKPEIRVWRGLVFGPTGRELPTEIEANGFIAALTRAYWSGLLAREEVPDDTSSTR